MCFCCLKQPMSSSTFAIKIQFPATAGVFPGSFIRDISEGSHTRKQWSSLITSHCCSSSPTTQLFKPRDWTYEFTHNTTMFFHRFLVPTTLTMQTFFGLLVISFSSSEKNQIRIVISLRRVRRRTFTCELRYSEGCSGEQNTIDYTNRNYEKAELPG